MVCGGSEKAGKRTRGAFDKHIWDFFVIVVVGVLRRRKNDTRKNVLLVVHILVDRDNIYIFQGAVICLSPVTSFLPVFKGRDHTHTHTETDRENTVFTGGVVF